LLMGTPQLQCIEVLEQRLCHAAKIYKKSYKN
jgi:hypothetical protein